MAESKDFKSASKENMEALRKEIGMGLRNRLVFPKTILGLLRDGRATQDQLLRMENDLDRAIRWVDDTFSDFIEGAWEK